VPTPGRLERAACNITGPGSPCGAVLRAAPTVEAVARGHRCPASAATHPAHAAWSWLSLSTQSAQHDDASITATPRPGTETKPAATTTEFVAYVLTVAAVLIASALVGDTAGRGDVFLADQAPKAAPPAGPSSRGDGPAVASSAPRIVSLSTAAAVLPSRRGPHRATQNLHPKPIPQQVVVVMGASSGIGRATAPAVRRAGRRGGRRRPRRTRPALTDRRGHRPHPGRGRGRPRRRHLLPARHLYCPARCRARHGYRYTRS
jgi:hypothetical protein